jgi:hypothetical protein
MAKRLRWLRWTLAIVVVVVLAAIAVPFLVPLSSFIPRVSADASTAIGQPVRISELQLQLLPTPRAVAIGIRVGKSDEVRIEELQLVPNLAAFLRGDLALSLVRAEKVELKEAALLIPKKMPKGDTPVAVKRFVALDVHLQHSALRLPPFNIDVELDSALAVRKARFTTRDEALKLTLDPETDTRSGVKVEASRWKLPLTAAPLVFDSLRAEGVLEGKRLTLAKIEGRLYGGRLAGNARAAWAKGWQVAGRAELQGIDLAPLQQALGKPPRMTGRLTASAGFSASARLPELLANALMLDGPFNVAGGVYRGVDLTKVGDLTGGRGSGGVTQFDELRGILQLRGKQIRVSELCAKSSVLNAGGFVEIAPDQNLNGRMDVALRKTAGIVGIPVVLSGTVQDPSIRPTRGYTVGAVVGTVLLPGVGTALGGSAGGAVSGKAADCK